MQPELLPEDIGDEWGELTTMDRTLSITAGPKPVHEKPIDPELLEKLKRNEKLKTGKFVIFIHQRKLLYFIK
jgi:hypothetical protein